MWTQKLVWSA